MVYYQPTVHTFTKNWFTGKITYKKLYPASLIFADFEKAKRYQHEYVEGLKRHGVKLKKGRWQVYNAQVAITEIKQEPFRARASDTPIDKGIKF